MAKSDSRENLHSHCKKNLELNLYMWYTRNKRVLDHLYKCYFWLGKILGLFNGLFIFPHKSILIKDVTYV